MSKPKLVAVPDAALGTTAGAIVYWRISGGLDLLRLREAWEAEGLPAKLLPEEPSPTVALRRAVRVLKTSDTRVESTRQGLQVLDVREDTDGELHHTKRLVASVDKVGRIRVSFARYIEDETAVCAAYEEATSSLANEDISPWLSTLMPEVSALALRDTGGVYFVPAFSTSRLEAMVRALEASTEHVIAMIPALSSERAATAFFDALQIEADKELAVMRRELEEESLGERALTTRIRATEGVEAKLSRYEGLLGGNLEQVRERILAVRAELTVAMTKVQQAAEEAS